MLSFRYLSCLGYPSLSLFYSYFLALTSRVMARRVASAATRGKISSERYSDDAFSILFCFFDFCVFLFFPYRGMDKYDDLDIVDDMSAFSVLSVPFACRLV